MPIIVDPPSAATDYELLVIDPDSVNPVTLTGATDAYSLEALDLGIAQRRPQWLTGNYGSILVEDPPYDDATLTATIKLRPAVDGNMDQALTLLNALTLKAQECSAAGPDGLPVDYTPAGASTTWRMFWKLVELDGAPEISWDATWFAAKPTLKLKVTRRPFFYGQTVTGTPVTSSSPLVTLTIPSVGGDVPAELRLVITDASGNSRRYVEVGLEHRHASVLALELDSSALVTTGFGSALTTQTGSVNANIVRGTVSSATTSAFVGLGALGHVGAFRVHARLRTNSSAANVRLSWSDGSSSLRPNSYATIPANTWSDADLGTVTITEALSGTQQWTGQLEGYTAENGRVIDVDYLLLIPAGEGYGKARAPYRAETITAFQARDEFDQSSGALAGKTLPVGGTWSGAGDADDFTIDSTNHWAQRTAQQDADQLTGRYAVAGTATFTNTLVQVDGKRTSNNSVHYMGVFARYTDTNNWLAAVTTRDGVKVIKRVAGVNTDLAGITAVEGITTPVAGAVLQNWFTVRLVADTEGHWIVWAGPQNGTLALVATGMDTDLATGGTLQTGKVGIYDADFNAAATTGPRYYDNFLVSLPTASAVIYANKSAEIRSDAAERYDSTGTVLGPVPSYYGARIFLPPAGTAGRASRIAVRAARNDLEEAAYDNPSGDSLTVQVFRTERYLLPT